MPLTGITGRILCDYHDAPELLHTRDVIRGILRLLPQNADLSKNDYRSIRDVPQQGIDPVYKALALYDQIEPWWRETLREALLARLLLSPAENAIQLIADALERGLPIALALKQEQKWPVVRIQLLADCLMIEGREHQKLAAALTDTITKLRALHPLRDEVLHPENAAELERLRDESKTPSPTPSPRERLARFARDIGVAALAQRREYHAPPDQRRPTTEMVHELVKRSEPWSEPERTALEAALILGRLGCHILRTNNQDSQCRIERDLHETWIERHLPDLPEFTRKLDGSVYANVGRTLHLPLPRRLGDALTSLCAAGEGARTLRTLEKKLRHMRREINQPITLRRLTRIIEYMIEAETPDEAVMTLLGMQAQTQRDAGIHYFAPSASELASRFRGAIEQLAESLNLNVLDQGWSAPPATPTPFIGYSYRADINAVRSLLATLETQARVSRGKTSPERITAAYNARVARLTLMYLAGTGARPTDTVLPRRGDISLDDRAAIASEKDSQGYRSTRLVALSDALIGAIREFETWAVSRGFIPRAPLPDAPFAMLCAADGSYTPPAITAMKAIVPGFSEYWIWPDDMFRHLFRSRLWEMGCPSSWLRRAMGHHPRHGAADMVWSARPQWEGLHDWTHRIDDYLGELGF